MASISNVLPVELQPGIVVPTSVTVMVTGATNATTIIKRMVFANTDSVPVAFAVYRVPSGGSPVLGNQIIPSRAIPASSTDLCPELASMVLASGDTIQAVATIASQVNCFCSGYVAS